eukprot:gene29042-38089_t
MSCGNTKQQLERAGIYALDTCKAPYRINADNIGICNSFYSEHRDETALLTFVSPPQLLTVKQAPSQRLDLPPSRQSDTNGEAFTQPSHHKSAEHCYPPQLQYWEDIQGAADRFVERDAIALTSPLWPRRADITFPAYSEEHVRQRPFLEMALPLNECGLGDVIVGAGAVQNELLPRSFKYAICKSDLFFRDDVGAFSVGEAKTSTSVAKLSQDARSVVAAYTAIVCNTESERGSESMTLPIAQLHGYMVQQQCRYGLITTHDMTWFFKIVPTGSDNSYAMAISDGFPVDYSFSQPQTSSSSSSSSSPEVTCTLLLYFMHLAKVDASPVPGFPPVQRLVAIGRDDASAQHDSPPSGEGAGDEDDQDPEYEDEDKSKAPSSKRGSKRPNSSSSKSSKKQRQIGQQNNSYRAKAHRTSVVLKSLGQETFFDAQRSVMISWGSRSGEVYRYSLLGTNIPVAVKSFSMGLKETRAALQAELKNYHQLKKLQGVVIPRVFGIITFQHLCNKGIVMDLLEPLPDDFKRWSPEQRRSGKMALETLLDQCDAQQNDLRADNFGVDPVTGQVMVLDLEDITIGPTTTGGISRETDEGTAGAVISGEVTRSGSRASVTFDTISTPTVAGWLRTCSTV